MNVKSLEDWKSVDTDSLPPEYCPDVVTEFALKSSNTPVNRITGSLFYKLRKHLVSLGWRIESISSQGSVKYRYTSPGGEILFSLSEACHKLKQSPTKQDSVVLQDDLKRLLVTQENDSNGDCSADEPELCLEAVVYWYHNGLDKNKKNSDMKLKAKKHLLAEGWRLWHQEKKGRHELRYTSCDGKTYYSLRMACKRYLEEGGVLETIHSSKNLSSLRNEESQVPFQTEESLPEESARKHRRIDETCAGVTQGDKDIIPRRGKVMKKLINSNDQNIVQPPSTTAVGQSSRTGRRGHKSIFSYLIESNIILPMARVRYGSKDNPIAQGYITHEGIVCDCCHRVFQLSAFEVHAGSKNHRPAANIFLDGGRSIAQCIKQADNKMWSGSSKPRESRKRNRNEIESYHICAVCNIGGELIECEQCAAAYHKDCLGLNGILDGKWYCPACCCRICGKGKFEGATEHSSDDNGFVRCGQCEHNFHLGCIKEGQRAVKLQKIWFCSASCHKAFSALHELLQKPISVGSDDLTWRLLKFTKKSGHQADPNGSIDSETAKKANKKLKAALDVMHECFESVRDPLTGKDLVADVVLNAESEKRQSNYTGFYTAVLERNSSVMTVATVRIFDKIAEIPLIATRFRCRKQGMCRLMMSELERQLMAIGVKKLILPSAASALDTWTNKFGYSKMTESEKLELMHYSFLSFSDTILCQKQINRNDADM